jgi:hypothetical protein
VAPLVFTLPAAIADIAYQNKAVLYDMLFKVSAETMLMIAADPNHLGARIGITSVLHTWGSALTPSRYEIYYVLATDKEIQRRNGLSAAMPRCRTAQACRLATSAP